MSPKTSFRPEWLSQMEQKVFCSFLTENGKRIFGLNTAYQAAPSSAECAFAKIKSGKVRNIYASNFMIFETSNRLSVFDRVVKENVARKGEMLNLISQSNKAFLEEKGIMTDLIDLPIPEDQVYTLAGFDEKDFERLAVSKKLQMFPLEFIVRGYITGSAWKAYSKGESYCGITFPKNLKKDDKLETPVLTPTTKAEEGHDEPVKFSEAIKIVADWLYDSGMNIFADVDINEICCSDRYFAEEVFDITRSAEHYAVKSMDFDTDGWWKYFEFALTYMEAEFYVKAIYKLSKTAFEELSKKCDEKGILFIDTKFEFGLDRDGNICLGDEVGTPDSSRFASKEIYNETGKIVSMDKQIVRDAFSEVGFTGDEEQDIPVLSDELWEKVTNTYVHIAELLCGYEEPKN